MFNRLFKCFVSSVCVFTALVCVFTTAFAEEAVAVGKILTVVGVSEETAVSGMSWKLYYVGSRTAEGEYELSKEFAEYQILISPSFSASELQAAAYSLENCAIIGKIQPLAEMLSDSDGIAVFNNLNNGVYLLSGEEITINKTTYTPTAALIEISDQSVDNGIMTAYAKFETKNIPKENTPIDTEYEYSIVKLWEKDENFPECRPETVKAEIYCDGEFYEAVELSPDNDWTYRWVTDEHHNWKVMEIEVSKDYSVTYQADGEVFTITNTCKLIQSTADELKEPEPDEPASPSQSDEPALPQTGQLRWPVPIMALFGLTFMTMGCIIRNSSKKD